MLKTSLQKMKEAISASSLENNEKEELLSLASKLDNTLTDLSKTNQEDAESIAGFSNLSTREHLRKEESTSQKASEGLEEAVKKFETSNPELTALITTITNTLSRIGI